MPIQQNLQRDQIPAERARLAAAAREILNRSTGNLSDVDQAAYDELMADLEALKTRDAALERIERLAAAGGVEGPGMIPAAGPGSESRPVQRSEPRHPLQVTPEALDRIQAAIDGRRDVRVLASESEPLDRAALTTATYGAPRAWGANVLGGPRLLHMVAGVPGQNIDAALAHVPQLTLPGSQAGVGETVTLPEYATSTPTAVTLQRFGRFTDFSQESLVGADAGAVTSMHRIGVAKDLDTVLINAVEAAAGAAVGFTADVPAAIRKAIAQVVDNTAAADASQLVVLVHPDNASLLQDVSPIGGQTIAEGFQRFSGALVYASSAVDTGFVTVANLQAGTRYFEARGLQTVTDVAVKTSVLTVATDVIGGYGVGLTGGFAVKVDVVTP